MYKTIVLPIIRSVGEISFKEVSGMSVRDEGVFFHLHLGSVLNNHKVSHPLHPGYRDTHQTTLSITNKTNS